MTRQLSGANVSAAPNSPICELEAYRLQNILRDVIPYDDSTLMKRVPSSRAEQFSREGVKCATLLACFISGVRQKNKSKRHKHNVPEKELAELF